MKKTIIIFFILLAASLSQSFGQAPPAPIPPVPGAKLLSWVDFGGNNPTDHNPAVAADSLPKGRTNLYFSTSYSMPDNHYLLAKTTSVRSTYLAWWGGPNRPQRGFDDHTFPGDTTRGYMMVVNAANVPAQFYTDTIRNLCPNTHLYFRAYVGNLVIDSTMGGTNFSLRDDPWLRFALINPANDLDTLAQSPPTKINKTNLRTGGPTWVPISLQFDTRAVNSVKVVIMDTARSGNGNDLVLDDIQVWLSVPLLSFSNAVNYFCLGDPMRLPVNYIADSIKATYGNSPYIQWLYHTNPTDTITKWTPVGGGLLNVVGPICTATAQAGYYMAVIGANIDPSTINNNYTCCSISSTTEVQASPPNTLYWKKTPANRNWNDSLNWELAGGAHVSYYPGTCNDVHIPGYSSQYPSLDTLVSGNFSACNNIWFHFGGMVEKTHLLKYTRAHVEYNFGKSGGVNGDPYSAPIMLRGKWYALAAPLQKMASGDFAVGGYPNFWQQRFRTVTQPNGDGALVDDWYTPENNTDWDIESQYNAIDVWAGDYHELGLLGEGPNYQTNLDGLNGVLEMPYFETQALKDFHRGFSHTGGVSYFQYYYRDQPGLPLIPASVKPFGSIARAEDAYHFIFENTTLFQKTLDGNKVVYSMPVPSGQDIMIGNPFMSELNFDSLAKENPLIDTYRLYDGTNYLPYSTTAGSPNTITQYIAPLQAFFINTNGASSYKFYANEASVANPANYQFKASNSGNKKPDVLYLKATSADGVSWLTLSMQKVQKSNLSLLLPKDYPNIPQIYAVDAAGKKNVIQFEGNYVDQVPLGILSQSANNVTVTMDNKEQLNVETLVLWDKKLNIQTDFKLKDSYTFTNIPGVPDRFVLVFNKKVLTGITPAAADNHQVFVNVTGNTIFVNATSGIADVSVITLQGITLLKESAGGQTAYTKSLQLPSGLYLVAVKLTAGETKVVKIRK